MSQYLLEIGVEEFPFRRIAATKEQLVQFFSEELKEEGLTAESLRCASTPRRFTLWAENIAPLDTAREEIVRGPAKRIAYDEAGAPTKALLGFLRSKGAQESDVFFETKGKDTYVFVRLQKKAISVAEVLARIVPKVIRRISNPRAMRWGGKNLQFLRPIRWFLSLLDDEVLPFDVEGIPVGRTTRGHRVLGSQNIVVAHNADYEALLEENYVIVDEEERRRRIVRGLNRLASEKGGEPLADEDLMNEVVSLVEYPTVFLGHIPTSYLTLPPEVLITPMKDQQRYFPVVDDRGKLLPLFLSVRNGDAYGLENVVKGNEKVLIPRLEDARFFYEQDLKKPLEAYEEALHGLVFHEGLGTMADKSDRLVSLVEEMGGDLSVGTGTVQNAMRAARLSKCDLVTHMVVEFTELQGTMGRLYAGCSGENDIVAQAIEEQYMPRYSGAPLPRSTAGTLLSLCDNIDTIAGLYAIGTEVSGSQDPFGLRRAAIGIIDIACASKLYIDFEAAFREAFVAYVEQFSLVFDYDETMKKIRGFFLGRLENKLRESGIRYDVAQAVLAAGPFDLCAWTQRAKVVQKHLDADGDARITTFVRVESLAEKASTTAWDSTVLQEEDRMLEHSMDRGEEVERALAAHRFADAWALLCEWMPTLDAYLDATMILVEDEALRNARLGMLGRVYECITQFLVPKEIVRQ